MGRPSIELQCNIWEEPTERTVMTARERTMLDRLKQRGASAHMIVDDSPPGHIALPNVERELAEVAMEQAIIGAKAASHELAVKYQARMAIQETSTE